MGGTGLSEWALAKNAEQVTYHVSRALNCPVDSNFLTCMRKRPLNKILDAAPTTMRYETAFGPVPDGKVIPRVSLDELMRGYNGLFSR